jgi:hypothetical protein
MVRADSALSREQKTQILRELETVLESAAFRGSRRGQQFLTYTVEQALAGRADALKERSIGIELFGRAPSYETGEDAIVRVAAKEVRTRLGQYYAGLAAPPAVRLELAPGSYVPEFHWCGGAAASVRLRKRWLPAAAVLAAVAGCGLAWFLWLGPARGGDDPLVRFWAPVVARPRPVLICMANPIAYTLDDEVLRRFGSVGRRDSLMRPVTMPPDAVVHGRQIIPMADEFVGVGDATAAARLTALLARAGTDTQVRVSNDLSFAELRDSPAVLIGAFTNTWTVELMKDWPYVFDLTEGYTIRERAQPRNGWRAAGHREQKVTEDYALISHVFDPRSGQPLVLVAGITQFGTAAAAEFLSKGPLLATALRDAPPDWDRKNLQIVIKTNVIRRIPGSPQFVASRYW